MRKERSKHQLGIVSPGGAGRNRVMNKKDFLKLKLPFPTLKEQTKTANFLSKIDYKINAVNAQTENTKTYKKELLQGMFVN